MPRPTCSTMSGSASASAGIGMPMRRTAARPLTASATSQPTRSAGARLGAAAMIAAKSSDAVAAAAHEVAAPNTANASQRQQHVREHGSGPSVGERDEERRRDRPREARDGSQGTALGQAGRGEPGADRRGRGSR